MFDEESCVFDFEPLDTIITRMEQKAQEQKNQQANIKYLEFTKMVFNSISLMQQKFNEMSTKFDKLQSKENKNPTTSNIPMIAKKPIHKYGKQSVIVKKINHAPSVYKYQKPGSAIKQNYKKK